MSIRAIAMAILVFLSGACLASAQNEDGRIAFNTHCRNCHSVKKGDNRLGPSLHAIFGAEAGQVEGFKAYSGSLAGFRWDEATLDRFIMSPSSVAPTTNMNYPPVGDPAERAKIIDFLKDQAAP